ncbi:hypothetical protein [Ancylobacter sp. IITR112]
MSGNPSRPITIVLLIFLAVCMVATDVQHIGLLDSAIAALRAAPHGERA